MSLAMSWLEGDGEEAEVAAEGEEEGEAEEKEGLAAEGLLEDSSSALEGGGSLEAAGLSDRECACKGEEREGSGRRGPSLAPPPGLSAASAEGRRRPETAALSEERLST